MAFKKKPQMKTRRPKVVADCVFCKSDKEPDYKEYKELRRFVSERSKIIGKEFTGICSKHQRRLSKAIKRARQLGLLPFRSSV